MRAVPLLILALASACIMPVRSSGAGGSSPGYASSGSSGSSGSYGSDGSSGYAASTPASATTASAPAAPSTVSVTIRSSCSKTVSVFYGDKPRFGSGTTSSVSSNSVSSHTFSVGDMMWVLDDSGEGVGSVTISENTRNVEINSSCGGISAR